MPSKTEEIQPTLEETKIQEEEIKSPDKSQEEPTQQANSNHL